MAESKQKAAAIEVLLAGPKRLKAATAEGPRQTQLHQIVSLQEFDGAFPMSEELALAVGKPLADLKAAAAEVAAGLDATCFSSAAAVACLRKTLGDFEGQWELVVGKTLKWLKAKAGPQVEDLIKAAAALF